MEQVLNERFFYICFALVLHGLFNALKKILQIDLAKQGMVKCNISIRLVSNPVDLCLYRHRCRFYVLLKVLLVQLFYASTLRLASSLFFLTINFQLVI